MGWQQQLGHISSRQEGKENPLVELNLPHFTVCAGLILHLHSVIFLWVIMFLHNSTIRMNRNCVITHLFLGFKNISQEYNFISLNHRKATITHLRFVCFKTVL